MAEEKKGNIFEEDPESEMVEEPEQFLEPEEHEDTHMEHKIDIAAGEQEADVYTEEGREVLTESGEIEPWEEGFAEGAEDRGELATCAHCREVLGDREDGVIERSYSNEVFFFCSEKCASAGPKR